MEEVGVREHGLGFPCSSTRLQLSCLSQELEEQTRTTKECFFFFPNFLQVK